MRRRAFLNRGIAKVTEAGIREVESRIGRVAKRWIRPPFALPEIDFLLACTRCDACIEACPYDVVFSLPKSFGPAFAGTPALDLRNRGCRICDDWPCVTACEPGALASSLDCGDGQRELPRFGLAHIDQGRCLPFQGPECGACAGSCPVPGALRFENERPIIEDTVCIGCGLCLEACIVEPKAVSLRPLNNGGDDQLRRDSPTAQNT